MKQIIVTILFALPILSYADNENIYCGKGKESYIVDDAQIALVVEGDKMDLYLDGKKATKDYNISKTGAGYEALAKGRSRNNPKPSFAFEGCSDEGMTSARFINSPVSDQPLPCTCERN